MAREYVVRADSIALTGIATATVLGINPAAGTVIEILRCWASQFSSTSSAQQRIILGTKASVWGTYTAATPAKIKSGDPLSGIGGTITLAIASAAINATLEGAGAFTATYPDAFNILNGWLWVPTPRETFMIRAADSLAFDMHLPVMPGTTTGWNFACVFSELG